jgi:hypothetical protein
MKIELYDASDKFHKIESLENAIQLEGQRDAAEPPIDREIIYHRNLAVGSTAA